ncbi:MAG: hypothetical protein KA116_12220 [Proteobacteria bacterium]|nr:hypothetical protein [Pseudomonadota bacterium]
MNVWIVSSELTFVPGNYQEVLLPLVKHPDVKGLIILKNRNPRLLLKGLFFALSGLARGIGINLVKNYFRSFFDSRRKLFKSFAKKVVDLNTMNSSEALQLVSDEKIDLLINARTRDIYKTPILKAPTLGCINIHHGLLPDQRGVFCDLWAISQARDAGFSIHKMSEKLDDGEILKVKTVSTAGSTKSFKNYLNLGPKLEGEELFNLLNEIKSSAKISGIKNIRTPNTKYFKNPKISDLKRLKSEGFSL